MTIELNRIYNEDCLEGMRRIPDKSVDMILCDLPYGTTRNKWDSVLPFDQLWAQYERVIKDCSPIVLTSSQPFTTSLIASNMRLFKYCWVWNKALAGNGILAKIQPLKIHEDICVFGRGKTTYYPQMRKGKGRIKGGIKDNHGTFSNAESPKVWSDEYYPTSVLEFSGAGMRSERVHPTQKPVDLFRYLIRTYTNPGEIVLDNCMGSGTTAVAATLEGRNFIGFETDAGYVEIANQRLAALQADEAAA